MHYETCNCPQCMDDLEQQITGCRFGQSNCDHEDCKRPVAE